MLKEFVQASLSIKQVGPDVLNNVDVLIQRSILRLQAKELLPSRKLEFVCGDRKEEMCIDGEHTFNYFYLPKDFRKLDEFRPMKTYPYDWVSDEYSLINNRNRGRKFTIIDTNYDEDSKSEKILIASPFPKDDETIQIKYYVSGENTDWEWIPQSYHESIIVDIEQMLGIGSVEEVEEQLSRAVARHKGHEGNVINHGKHRLKGTFFGRR